MLKRAQKPKEAKEPKAKEPKQKARVKQILKEKVSKNKGHNTSEDLTKLTEEYNIFCMRLAGLVKALMHQHAAMQALAKAKLQVAQHLALLSRDSVLYEMAGQSAGPERSSESVNSYFSIQEGVCNKNIMYVDKYKQFVVDYAQEWYTAVTTRVGEGLKKAETMRVELSHYQSKVESLRQSANSTMAKGKQIDTKTSERLTRNEDKLIKTKEETSRFINDLCLLMEEITERSWRDLHPLLVKCAQFETQVSGDESKSQAALGQVVAALKKVADDHGINAQARLKDIRELDPHTLSTRSKEDSRNLALENGMAGMGLGGGSGSVHNDGSIFGGGSAYSNDNNSAYFAPGTTAPQGLGGFPVKVKSNADVFSSGGIHTAPAPTIDTMAQAFGGGGGASSHGSSHSRTMGAPSYGRMSSNVSNDSNFSGYSNPAPPPSSAPPPPPPATPGYGAPAPASYGVATYPQQGYGQHQSPMPPAGYGQHQSPMPPTGGYGQPQPSPVGGGFAQQSPMGGTPGGSFSQSPMFTSPPPYRSSAPPPPYDPFG